MLVQTSGKLEYYDRRIYMHILLLFLSGLVVVEQFENKMMVSVVVSIITIVLLSLLFYKKTFVPLLSISENNITIRNGLIKDTTIPIANVQTITPYRKAYGFWIKTIDGTEYIFKFPFYESRNEREKFFSALAESVVGNRIESVN